jgi:hypothetical protein
VSVGGVVQNVEKIKFGVREFTYTFDSNLVTLYCNGTRIVCKGGNWGMDDALKLDTPETYDAKVRLHAEENFTMIRSWVGQTNNEAFYDACDKYGVLIWDDFWLANAYDGPEPANARLFVKNAYDKVKKVRPHTALAFYIGRNEGNPPDTIEPWLEEHLMLWSRFATDTSDIDWTRPYWPMSSGNPAAGGSVGYSLAQVPTSKAYTAANLYPGIKSYFNVMPDVSLVAEAGLPNVPSLESMKKFLPSEKLWPINESWALHDWTYAMNGPANTFMDSLKLYKTPSVDFPVPDRNTEAPSSQNPAPNDPVYIEYQGKVADMIVGAAEAYTLEDFAKMADMINYENYKGVYEGLNVKRSSGFLMWMSQSSWPSFMWQTYDWYLNTNAGYFGAKAANQPTHATWDPRNDNVVLANLTPNTYANVSLEVKVFDLSGATVSEQVIDEFGGQPITLGPDTYGLVVASATSEFAKSSTPVVFLRLTLKSADGTMLGDNFYWHNKDSYMMYQSLGEMDEAPLTVKASAAGITASGNLAYTVTLMNDSGKPALLARIRTTNDAEGEMDVLPTFYSDNYVSLMPGESRTVTLDFADKDLGGGEPHFFLSGWNVPDVEIAIG